MNKYIFVTNGMARSGKDTFAVLMNEFVPTKKYSSIESERERLSLLKRVTQSNLIDLILLMCNFKEKFSII